MAHSPPYCTLADLLALRVATERELIELTGAGTGTIDEAAVAAAAETAAIEIDPYLAAKTTVPLATVWDPIKRLACILTRYYLYTDQPTEHVDRQYQGAVRTLQAMADGRISIGAPAATPPAGGGAEWSSVPTAWGRDSGGGLA